MKEDGWNKKYGGRRIEGEPWKRNGKEKMETEDGM